MVFLVIIEGACLFCFVLSLFDWYYHPKWRTMRVSLYVFVGVGGVFPCAGTFLLRDPHYIPWSNVYLWGLGGALYVGGAVIYATKIPE